MPRTATNAPSTTWAEQGLAPFAPADKSATEGEPKDHPMWDKCLNGLLDTWQSAPVVADLNNSVPTRDTVCAATAWLRFLKAKDPQAAPTLITHEPSGGLIIERRSFVDSRELIWELTLTNDRTATWTWFVDGMVVSLMDIDFNPPQVP